MAKILLMEDDPDQAMLLVEGLSGAHQVEHCMSASAALERLQAEEFDIVVTDILVQRAGVHVADGGMLLIGRLRKPLQPKHLKWWAKVPIIAITGSTSAQGGPNFLTVAKTLGADAVLRKPFRIDELLSELDRLLA